MLTHIEDFNIFFKKKRKRKTVLCEKTENIYLIVSS